MTPPLHRKINSFSLTLALSRLLDGFSDAAEAAIVDGLASFLDINPTYVELSTAEFVMSGSDVELNVVKFVCTAREQPENPQRENRCVWARALLCTIEWPGKTLRASANTTDWGWRWRERACERLTLSCQKYPSLCVYFDMKRTWEGAICIDQASYFGFYAGVTGGPPGCHLLVPGTEGTFPVYTTDDELEDNDSRSSTPDMNHDG